MSLLNFNRFRARRLHHKAQNFSDSGNEELALSHYNKALDLDSHRPTTLYNIGLIFKFRREWEKSLEFNARAYELAPDDEASRWNLAIAATALRRWDLARQAWIDNGMELEGTDGPIEMDFGTAPVRLNAEDEGEVVWASRVDPVRARIENVPFPESGFRKGDIVLHDGAAMGYRVVDDREYPVFNVLELFEPSTWNTYRITARAKDQEDIDALADRCLENSAEFEDWTRNVRALCKQCSEGVPHETHDTEGEVAWCTEREIGLSCESEGAVDKILSEWKSRLSVEVVDAVLALKAGNLQSNED